jgi:hypothetical protein
MPTHDDCPLHVTAQLSALKQLMPCVHEFCWLHSIVQRYPVGQLIGLLQFAVWQLMSHVRCATLHDEHCDGHPLPLPMPSSFIVGPSGLRPATTQKPSMHVRLLEQSDCFVQL